MHSRVTLALTAALAATAGACVAILGIEDPPPIGPPDGGADAAAPEAGADAADAGPYANAVLADRPLLYYRLGETTGPAIDLGAIGARGAYGGAVGRGTPGLLAGDLDLAASFPGPNAGPAGIVTTPETTKLEPTGEITVECWVKADTFAGTMRIVSYGSDDRTQSYEAWVLQIQFGKASFYSGALNGTGAEANGVTDVPPGVHHLAGTYDGAALQVYLDGDPEIADGGLRATGALGNYDTVHGLGIGGGFVDGAGFKGTIDEVAVYSKALPASRIREHYVAGR